MKFLSDLFQDGSKQPAQDPVEAKRVSDMRELHARLQACLDSLFKLAGLSSGISSPARVPAISITKTEVTCEEASFGKQLANHQAVLTDLVQHPLVALREVRKTASSVNNPGRVTWAADIEVAPGKQRTLDFFCDLLPVDRQGRYIPKPGYDFGADLKQHSSQKEVPYRIGAISAKWIVPAKHDGGHEEAREKPAWCKTPQVQADSLKYVLAQFGVFIQACENWSQKHATGDSPGDMPSFLAD